MPESSSETALPFVDGVDVAAVLRAVADAMEAGTPCAMATVVARRGSAPSTEGQRLAVIAGESLRAIGTVGGGAVERSVLRALVEAARDGGASRVETFKLGPELGMCCGGSVDVLIEPIASATTVLVVGAGHIGSVLGPMLARCGFAVILADSRDDHARARDDDPPRLRRVLGDFDDAGRGLSTSTAVLTMTHDHQLDQQVVEWAIARGFAFVGGVGSRAKHARTLARLEAKGVAEADRARVRMPLGLSINARSPEEIAISIAAELIAWRSDRPRS
ncbi:MAG: XdhC family protein [Polyangiales bacterium]